METFSATIKGALIVITTFISLKLGIFAPLLICLFVAIIIDYISGMIASSISGALSSKRGIIGILKKLGYFFAVIVALIADKLILLLVGELGVQINQKAVFGLLITIWLTLNELLSIIENLGRMGVPLPKFLQKAILMLKKTVDKKGEE